MRRRLKPERRRVADVQGPNPTPGGLDAKRLGSAVVLDNAGKTHERVYFGATVTVVDGSGAQRTVSIVGVDELDPSRGRVSWISPIATALLKASIGDVVTMRTPRGAEELEVVAIRYDELS